MIYTSYFGKLKSLPKNIIPITICAKCPDWYDGLQYKKLIPKFDFFMKYKQDQNVEDFSKSYEEQVLQGLDPAEIEAELEELLPAKVQKTIEMINCPLWENNEISIALICFERPEYFCHRKLVAEWFNVNGIKCQEFDDSLQLKQMNM